MKYVTKRTKFERVRLIGPMDQCSTVLADLGKESWSVTQSGPFSNKKMFPKCDTTRFIIVAERKLP